MSITTRPLNPVLAREVTERMRGPRAMIMLTIYLAILSLILVLVYRAESGVSDPFSSPLEVSGVGQGLFEWTLFFTLLLVLFLVPGFTAGSVAGERERQTLLPMQVTLLRPSSILLGKLGASVLFTMLLVISTLPLMTMAYLIGGIRLGEIVKGIGLVLFTAVALAAISVACSTFMKRVQTATVMSYGVVLFVAGATFAGFIVAQQIDESRGFDAANPPEEILMANPVAALADLVGDVPNPFGNQFFGPFGTGTGAGGGPLSSIRDLVTPDLFNQFEEFGVAEDVAFDQFGNPIVNERNLPGQAGFPLWGKYMVLMSGVSLLAVVLASRRLRTPAKTER